MFKIAQNKEIDQQRPTILKTAPSLWAIPLCLSMFGLLSILSISTRSVHAGDGVAYALVYRQGLWLILGLVIMMTASAIPTDFWKRSSGILWLFALILTFATIFDFFGVEAGGARRWIRVGPLGFQPIELLSFSLVIHLSKIISGDEISRRKAFLKTMAITLISLVPLFLQPDMGGTILVFLIAMAIYVEAHGWFYPLITGTVLTPPFLYVLFMESYRIRRYTAFMDPWKEPLDSGFQVIQGLIAFANGGVLGVGIGKGLQKLSYLPAAHTDFIFASIGEEFGLIGTLSIVMLFALWSARIFRSYINNKIIFERLLLWGMCISVLLPFFINVAGVTRLLPLTGMPLPFISYGGSSLVSTWLRTGLIIRIVWNMEISG